MAGSTWRYGFAKRHLKRIYALAPLFGNRWLAAGLRKMLMTPKDGGVVIPLNRSLGPVEEVVLPAEVVRHFIREARHRWIMKECVCRKAGDCRRYSPDLGCIFLGAATTGISPELGRSASCGEALAHLEACEAAGLIHIIGRLKIDAIAMDIKPYDRLLGICNCCECCCIMRAIPKVHRSIGGALRRLEGVSVSVGEACLGCGSCVTTCFVDAISVTGGKAHISEACRGCGRCVRTCPNGAITLTLGRPDAVEAAIRRLSSAVEV